VSVDNVYCVLLAGGNGERLWPLSTHSKPKQLLTLGGTKTLLEQAVERAQHLVCNERIFVSTTEHHAALIKATLGNSFGGVIVEPVARNTAPAFLLSCLEIYKKDPDAVVVFAHADAFIPKVEPYVEFLHHAIDFAQTSDRITLLGLRPTYPATGYGYIGYHKTELSAPFPVTSFKEKPSEVIAREYVQSGTMLWNIGIFCARVEIFLQQFQEHAPEVYAGVTAYCAGTRSYDQIPAASVDCAVMEKSDRISVLPVDFVWYDVGNVEVFLTLQEQFSDARNTVIAIDAHNNLVDAGGIPVALVGVDDLCVVRTDQALLITKRGDSEKVKLALQEFKRIADLEVF